MTGPASVLVQRGGSPPYRPARFVWPAARTDGDDVLLVSYTGKPAGFPRGAPPLYTSTARPEDGSLLVSVSILPAYAHLLSRGRAVGRVGIVRVELDGGWRGMEILDAADGQRRTVFDGAALLRPRPANSARGCELLGESGESAADGLPSRWSQNYLLPSGEVVALTHSDTGTGPGDGVPGRPITIRGQEGIVAEERDGPHVVTRTLTWSERAVLVSARSSAPGPARPSSDTGMLTLDRLVAFADALL